MIKSYDLAKTYFTKEELECKGTGELLLDPNFVTQLRTLRHVLNAPMALTSACRSPSHNEAIGGHPRSLHLTSNPSHPTEGCMACDVDRTKWEEDFVEHFIDLAWELGWSVGIAKTFIHIDRRVDIGLKQHKYWY